MSATPLLAELRERIAQDGPITVERYMALCLGHPLHGYYRTRDPLGAAGDFVTAPEISQIFGELLGLWAAQVWHDLGRPSRLVLAELGPGRGTLMADALRAIRAALPDCAGALDLHLVETSPVLRARPGAQPRRHPGAVARRGRHAAPRPGGDPRQRVLRRAAGAPVPAHGAGLVRAPRRASRRAARPSPSG